MKHKAGEYNMAQIAAVNALADMAIALYDTHEALGNGQDVQKLFLGCASNVICARWNELAQLDGPANSHDPQVMRVEAISRIIPVCFSAMDQSLLAAQNLVQTPDIEQETFYIMESLQSAKRSVTALAKEVVKPVRQLSKPNPAAFDQAVLRPVALQFSLLATDQATAPFTVELLRQANQAVDRTWSLARSGLLPAGRILTTLGIMVGTDPSEVLKQISAVEMPEARRLRDVQFVLRNIARDLGPDGSLHAMALAYHADHFEGAPQTVAQSVQTVQDAVLRVAQALQPAIDSAEKPARQQKTVLAPMPSGKYLN